jgi:hypothetical protein
VTGARLVRIRFDWLCDDDGARFAALEGSRWPALSRFPEQRDPWPDGSWTVMVEFDPTASSEMPTYGSASFMAPGAPHEWLHVDQCFGLYRGLVRVAEAHVLSVAAP